MSADGRLIAFDRCCTVIVLYDTTTGSSIQVTPANPSIPFGSEEPAISADGRRLAFASALDLTPNNPGNPNGNNVEIFTYDIATGSFTQITNSGGNEYPAINADGTRIAYAHTTGVVSSSCDIYLYDTNAHASTLIAAGAPFNGTGAVCQPPAINADGTRITYTVSIAGSSNPEFVYVYDTTTSSVTQIPHSSGNENNEESAINADGTRIAVNARNYGAVNAGFNLYDTTTNTLSSFNTGDVASKPAINADGTRVAVLSSTSSSTEELFLLTCGAPAPVVTVAATDPTAAEVGSNGSPDPGVFTLTRSGGTTNALTVNFNLTGTATQRTDYTSVGTSVTIPAGQTSATVTITPIPDTEAEGNETVILTLASGTGYTVGSPNTATVNIANYAGGLLRGPTSVNFNNVRVTSSADRSLNIANGSATVPLVVTVNNPSPMTLFSLVSAGGTLVIGPGLSQQVTLRFTPTSAGSGTGTLVLNSTDPANTTKSIALDWTAR